MRILVDGEWTEAEGDFPVVQDWNPDLTENGNATGDNRGCPPGYFCQLVAPPQHFWNPFYSIDSAHSYQRVCRRADEGVVNNPGVVKQESGPGLWDQNVINMADTMKQTVDAIKGAANAVTPSLNLAMVAIIVLGFVVITKR